MRKFVKILSILLVFSLFMSVSAFATTTDIPVKAIPGTAPNNGVEETPGGMLDSESINNLNNSNDTVTTKALIYPYYTYSYDCEITDEYNGYIDRGEVASGYNGTSSEDRLSASYTHTVSNSVSVSSKFPISKVEATVGYSISWSDSKTFTYSATVSPKKTCYIGYQDWYHVSDFDWEKITTKWTALGSSTSTSSGSGWSQQWYKYHFYSWEE